MLYLCTLVLCVFFSFKSNRDLLLGVSFFINGSSILNKKYETGRSYIVQTPEGRDVVLSSEAHVKELASSEAKALSMMTYFRDIFHMPYTMNDIKTDQVHTHQHCIKRFTQSLPLSYNRMDQIVQATIFRELDRGGETAGGWKAISPKILAEDAIGEVNFYSFFGDQCEESPTFLKEAKQYLIDIFVTSEILHRTPKYLASSITRLITRSHYSLGILRKILIPIVESGIENSKSRGVEHHPENQKPVFYVDYLVQYYLKRGIFSVSDIVQQCLAMWLAAMHQPSTTIVFLLHELSLHPEYIAPLRREIEENWTDNGPLLNNMKLLDSVIKESTRLNTSESISLRRKATSDYMFSDGMKVAAGTSIYVPLRAMGRDPNLFTNPEEFNGYRFVVSATAEDTKSPGERSHLRYTDINPKLPYWGFGLDACPGRFYAAFVLKTIMAHIIRNFDFKLLDESAPRTISWRSRIVPRGSANLLIRRRKLGSHDLEKDSMV